MDSFYRASRRGILVTIALCSMLGGLVLVWYLLRPGVINAIPTPQLLLILGLFVLPVGSVGAWAMDLKHLRSAPRELRGADTGSSPASSADSHAANISHPSVPGRDAAGAGRGPETHRHRRPSETVTSAPATR